MQVGRRKVRLTVQEGELPKLAALDEVRHIEEVPTRQLFNNVARPILDADVVVNGTPYQGDGEIVAVADTGFDKGSTSNVHPAFTGRVAKLYALGRTSPAKRNDPHGHGTHVAGSVLGDGNSASMGGAIQGTAPGARLVLQSTLDSSGGLGGIPADLHDLFQPPYDNDGARVHTNSWGATTPGIAYDASAREIDDFVWNHQDLVICFAAGNDGSDGNANGVVDAGSVGSQSAAKNCITVGASESNRPEFEPSYGTYWPSDFPSDPIESDRQANDPDGMVAFSSRGPDQGEAVQAGRRRAGDVHPLDAVARRRQPLDRLRDLVGLAVLLRQRDEHGHAAGGRLRRRAAGDAGQERHAHSERRADQGAARQRRGRACPGSTRRPRPGPPRTTTRAGVASTSPAR